MLKKSPSGSLCPYYYKGGELHPLHYGSYRNNRKALCAVMDAEMRFILASHGGRNVWIDLYETRVDREMAGRLAEHIHTISPKVARLALVGCTRSAMYGILRRLARMHCPLAHRIKGFRDPEVAKSWLVGKPVSR